MFYNLEKASFDVKALKCNGSLHTPSCKRMVTMESLIFNLFKQYT